MAILRLALDRSARHIDADGRLHVERTHISKATVNPYYGEEIPGYEALGLDPKTIYRLLRDPVELERGAATFARLPILSDHVPVTVDAPQSDLVVGAIGSNVVFESPYLDADICIWDAPAIAGIETDKVRELSCAYRYVPVMDAGEFEGQPYDGRMTEINGNHLALVEVGRAGPDVVVADRNPFKLKEPAMKMTKLGKALFAALCAASPVLAADSALPALVGSAARKNFKKDDTKTALLAMDASLDSNKLDAVLDAIMDVEETPTPKQTPMAAADEGPADKVKALLAGKVDDSVIEQICSMLAAPAADEGNSVQTLVKEGGEPKQPGMQAAMDGLRKDLREAADAAREVRPTVGDVIGMDSAADIYAFALDHMKVDHKDVKDAAALRALYKVASAAAPVAQVQMAADSDSLQKKFPAAMRFLHA